MIDDFIGEGATSLTIASQTTALDGLTSVGGSPSGAVSPNTESASATDLPQSDSLAADTPYTYDTTLQPGHLADRSGDRAVYLTPGDICRGHLRDHGTATPESISCTPPSGVAALGSITVEAAAGRPHLPGAPVHPALQNQVSAGTDGGWGATIANTSKATVTGLDGQVRVTDGRGPATYDLTGMAASGTTCATPGPGKVTCSLGNLAAGASATLDVLVGTNGLPNGATITGSATVTSSNAGTEATSLGAIEVVVVESGNGAKAVAAPGIALVSTKKTLKKAKASVSLTLPTDKIKIRKPAGARAGTGSYPRAAIDHTSPPPVAVTLKTWPPRPSRPCARRPGRPSARATSSRCSATSRSTPTSSPPSSPWSSSSTA